MIELPASYREIPDQAEQIASELRGKFHLGERGIPNLFSFVESTLGYLLFRYPFGKEAMQGFASPFHSQRLIVTNSSLRLGREIFTLAHELGHHLLDLDVEGNKMIGDQETGNFSVSNLIEYRADWFAACFLMPEYGVKAVFRELKQRYKVSYKLILQLQSEFSVSYVAMTRRLRDLNLISDEERNYLNDYYNDTHLGLGQLMAIYGGNKQLLQPSNITHIPLGFLETLKTNYENGWISYMVLQNTLKLVNMTPSDIGIEETIDQNDSKDDDSIFDKIISEYGE